MVKSYGMVALGSDYVIPQLTVICLITCRLDVPPSSEVGGMFTSVAFRVLRSWTIHMWTSHVKRSRYPTVYWGVVKNKAPDVATARPNV
jgi:hypothetical protein